MPARCRSTGGVEIAYDHAGTRAPTLVFVHGWSCARSFWREQIAFAERSRVVMIDLAGHGESTRGNGTRTWSMAAFAADVVAVLDDLAVDEAILIGHSMGGAVAVEAALRLGARCRRIVGIDTFTDPRFYGGRPPAEIAARCGVFEADFSRTMTRMIEQITAPAIDRGLRDWIAATMAATDRTVALAALEGLLSWQIEARWPHLTQPVVTLNAAMLETPDALALPRLHRELLADVGHFPMLEAPAAFDAALERLLTTPA